MKRAAERRKERRAEERVMCDQPDKSPEKEGEQDCETEGRDNNGSHPDDERKMTGWKPATTPWADRVTRQADEGERRCTTRRTRRQ